MAIAILYADKVKTYSRNFISWRLAKTMYNTLSDYLKNAQGVWESRKQSCWWIKGSKKIETWIELEVSNSTRFLKWCKNSYRYSNLAEQFL
jgi:uncharacterized protein YaeQ